MRVKSIPCVLLELGVSTSDVDDEVTLLQVVFEAGTGFTLNNYGYSPHPLAEYLSWVFSLPALSRTVSTSPFFARYDNQIPTVSL